jgi:threonine aldolase
MIVDLRSDTVTKPSPAMREAMARAAVGDDVYGEDPSVNALQERVAALLGKEAALYVPSGTMANQIALAIHTRPGDEVLVSHGTHCMVFESGAAGALSGVQFDILGDRSGRGNYTAAQVEAHISPDNHHFAPTTLVVVENTHNRGGGSIFPQRDILEIAKVARANNLALHLDGARLMNASVATGVSARELAAPFDTVSICLSKGLGAPVGSLIAGSKALVHKAHRRRKMLGGGMRQAGVLAAAAIHALDHHVARLADDHALARRLAAGLDGLPGLSVEPPQTNIVFAELQGPRAAGLMEHLKEAGVLATGSLYGPVSRLRFVTHLDVDAAGIDRAVAAVREHLTA